MKINKNEISNGSFAKIKKGEQVCACLASQHE